ncbi:Cell envelope-related transcriptional attenuator [metagenome]|uniref:Cell envelope-related transcriptional attenuator n=1 Tax=metagenome TaxID=256318 RepID=A0A2P2C1R4_9ZZZZ
MNARTLVSRIGKLTALATILGVTLVVVPDSSVAPASSVLVKVDQAHGVDLSPDVVWILALGSDARPGENMTRTRADAIQLVGINTKTGAAAAIGIPRDSYVPIEGVGSDRINASLYYGGPQLMAKSVGNLVGIEPDYVMITGFQGLISMVNDIGGITVDNPIAFSDEHLKENGFESGKIHLNGYTAMAFSRIRHNLAGGDFDRSANQQRTLKGILGTIREKADKPGFMEMGVQSVMKNMSTDLSPAELFVIAQAVAQVEPKKVTNCVLKGGFANVGGASVVTPDLAMAARFGREARKDATLETC